MILSEGHCSNWVGIDTGSRGDIRSMGTGPGNTGCRDTWNEDTGPGFTGC